MSSTGWFQDLPGQKSCHPCPPGFLCQAPSASSTRGSPIGASSPLPCPAGFTCPSENPESQPIPCPKGTYSPVQGLITTGNKRGPKHIFLHEQTHKIF